MSKLNIIVLPDIVYPPSMADVQMHLSDPKVDVIHVTYKQHLNRFYQNGLHVISCTESCKCKDKKECVYNTTPTVYSDISDVEFTLPHVVLFDKLYGMIPPIVKYLHLCAGKFHLFTDHKFDTVRKCSLAEVILNINTRLLIVFTEDSPTKGITYDVVEYESFTPGFIHK